MSNEIIKRYKLEIDNLFSALPLNITSKSMFGGYGYYFDGKIFALITSEPQLYFKADSISKEYFEKYGCYQFIYKGHHNKKPTVMPYWSFPEQVKNDKALLIEYIERSANLSVRK